MMMRKINHFVLIGVCAIAISYACCFAPQSWAIEDDLSLNNELVDGDISEGKPSSADESLSKEGEAELILTEDRELSSLSTPSPSINQIVADGEYLIESAKNLSQVVDVSGGSSSNGANVQSYVSNMTAAQKWNIAYDSKEDAYTIINSGSGKALDVYGAQAADFTNVHQYESNGTVAQYWRFVATPMGFKIISLVGDAATYVLDISGGNASNGGNIQIYHSNDTLAQRFNLLPVHPIVAPGIELAEGDGVYLVQFSADSSKLLDICGASFDNGANVQIYENNSTAAQRFYFEKVEPGFYTITNITSGLCLDAAGANLVPGTNVWQYVANGTDAQKWAISIAGSLYTFINKATGLVLDVVGGATSNGANVHLYASNNTAAQKFILTKQNAFVADGIYAIHPNIVIDKVIDIAGGSKASDAAVQVYTSNNTLAQRFELKYDLNVDAYSIQSAVSGKYLIDNGSKVASSKVLNNDALWRTVWNGTGISFVNVATERVFDVAGAGTADGTRIQTAVATGSVSQRFNPKNETLIANSMYILTSGTGSRVLDIAGGSFASGANAQLYTSNNTDAQKFFINSIGDGYYQIINARSNKALDVAGGGTLDGANVQQYDWNNTDAQKWKAQISPYGGVMFIGKGSGKALDVRGGADADGANVQIYTVNNSAAQAWSLTPTTYQYSGAQKRMYELAQSIGSDTNWLIMADISSCNLGIFYGSRGSWSFVDYVQCTPGAPSSPTITGYYDVTGYRKPRLSTDARAIYCTQFCGEYFFHSILSSTSELGRQLSHGCIRLEWSVAEWIYDNIPTGTGVYIYE